MVNLGKYKVAAKELFTNIFGNNILMTKNFLKEIK